MTLALLCSGQGLQQAGMFALTGDVPAAAPLFDRAAALLGGDPRALVRTATSDALHADRTGQILCTLQALAAEAALREALPHRRIVAGYSVGEIAAWSLAGIFDAAATLDLVARRAEAMDGASGPDDGLLFVRGLPRAAIDALCDELGAAIAIVNPGDAWVLGGDAATLERVAAGAKARGASRVARIGVRVASHTPRLADAATAFRRMLDAAPMQAARDPNVRLISGIDGTAVQKIASGLDKLGAQIAQTVHWDACLEAAVEAGATCFLELGPGRALSAMTAHAWPAIPSRSLDDFRTLDGVRAWLAENATV
jgi:[acyl-carrier-protein] S-malonyltransferase